MKKRDELDYMNAIACLLVILIHVLSEGIVTADQSAWQTAAMYLPWRFAAFVVPMFLYTAAVKVALRYDGETITWDSYLRYCLGRLWKIFVPYVLWCAVYYLVYMRFGQVSGTLWEFVRYLATGNLSAPLYFVVILMQFYFTVPLWLWLVRHVHAAVGMGICLFVSLCMAQAGPFLAHFGIAFKYTDRFCLTYCFFWAAGLYAGTYYDRLIPALLGRWTQLCGGAAVAACCLLSYAAYRYEIVLTDAFGIKLASDFLSILLLHAACLRLKQGFVTETLKKICRASYTVYLSHCLFLSILERLLAERGVTQLACTLPLRAAVCYTIPFLVYWILTKLRGVPAYLAQRFQYKNIKE